MKPNNCILGIPSAAEFISLQIHVHNTTFISMQICSDSPIPWNISWYTMTISSLDAKFIVKCPHLYTQHVMDGHPVMKNCHLPLLFRLPALPLLLIKSGISSVGRSRWNVSICFTLQKISFFGFRIWVLLVQKAVVLFSMLASRPNLSVQLSRT